jgi:pectinesterase
MIARRGLVAGGALLAALPAIARPRWDIVVSTRRRGAVATLAEALTLADRAGGRSFAILLDEGLHIAKPTIRTPNLTLAGVGPASILTFGAAAGHKRPDGRNWGTSGSATLTIDAPGVTLRDLTVRNSFDYIADRRTGASGGAQAVALAIGRGADRTRVERCSVEGFQDTLLVQARSFVRDCRISGNVDFIFGGGAAWFDRCEIVTRHVPGSPGGGYLAAPSTPRTQPFGLVFDHCRIQREAGVPTASTFLGRPWRAGGDMALVGSAHFIDCWLDAHIAPGGWTAMGGMQPWDARLFEYGSRGPGAGPASRSRRLLDRAAALRVTRRAALGDWMV